MLLSALQSLKNLRASPALKSLGEWHSSAMGYRKMGLCFDDLVPVESPLVTSALQRLTPLDQRQRLFRIRRAFALSGKQQQLPPSEWTSPAQDTPYLQPLLNQVEAEVHSKQVFDDMTALPKQLLTRNTATR